MKINFECILVFLGYSDPRLELVTHIDKEKQTYAEMAHSRSGAASYSFKQIRLVKSRISERKIYGWENIVHHGEKIKCLYQKESEH